jgi:CIC family chloride channel protein
MSYPRAALEMASAALVASRPRLQAILVAALVGLVAGLATVAFREAFGALQALIFGGRLDELGDLAATVPALVLVSAPALGGLLTGLLCWRWLPGRRPHGVPDAIEAAALRGSQLPIGSGLVAAAASVVSLGTGASVGREGPMIHLGATLGAWLTRKLRLPQAFARRMLACGAAAGVAASFNAPIAGVIFAVEVVVGRYTLHTFAPIVVASVAATVVSRLVYGESSAFTVPPVEITSYWELPAFALAGVAGALVTLTLIRTVGLVANAFDSLNVPAWLRPAFAGLGVGLVALLAPQVLGVGYGTTSAVLSGELTLGLLAALLLAKLLATGLSLGGGLAGGIFSPSLMLGALTGSLLGIAAATLYPGHASPQAVYTLIGMGAVAGAALGSPLSTTLIVFELTGNYPVTLAVMLATVLSSVIVNDLWGHSFFSWLLSRRGIDLRMRRVDALLQQERLEHLERRPLDGTAPASLVRLPADTTLATALKELRSAPGQPLVVHWGEGDESAEALVTAEEIMRAYQRVLDRVYAEEHGEIRPGTG